MPARGSESGVSIGNGIHDGEGRAAQPPSRDGVEAGALGPRVVIRGESFSPLRTHRYAAITDYLTVTFPFPVGEAGVSAFFLALTSVIGSELGSLTERRGGLLGFRRSYSFARRGAMFAFGGQNGRAMLMLPGEACHVVRDWHALAAYLRDDLRARITRWDGAVDDFLGQHTVDDAVAWYLADGFNAGGNRPSPRQDGNWLTPDTKGRTFYVGKRGNGKLMRIYEKGKQLGDPQDPWVRFEVELHNKDREIPFDVLVRPGHYVAGSYPCMCWISEEAFRVHTIQNQKRISYSASVHWASVAYGQLINAMMLEEGSAEGVVKKLCRAGMPARLDLPVVPPGEGLR
jgi:phage replication initiation protein